MTHSELKIMLEEKLARAKALIESAENGDKLVLRTEISYMDDDFNESNEFDPEEDETTVLAEIYIASAERCGEEDPTISHCMAIDLAKGEVEDESKIEEEYMVFDGEIDMFISKLTATNDVNALIESELERIKAEGEEMMRELEISIEKVKKYTAIGMGVAFVIMIVIFLIRML